MNTSFFRRIGNMFYIVDTETTGLKTETADAIEISALKVRVMEDGYRVEDTFDTYINPGYPLPPEIIEFNNKNNTGVTDELLAHSPSKKDAADRFIEFVSNGAVLVGHNIPFDMGFISKLLGETNPNHAIDYDTFDTLEMSREIKQEGRHRLCDMFELSAKKYTNAATGLRGFHNSLADCYATLDVLAYLVNG